MKIKIIVYIYICMYNVKHHTGYELEPLPGDSSFDKITNRSD